MPSHAMIHNLCNILLLWPVLMSARGNEAGTISLEKSDVVVMFLCRMLQHIVHVPRQCNCMVVTLVASHRWLIVPAGIEHAC